MILFRKVLGYVSKTPSPYHIVKNKGWRRGLIPTEMMSFVVQTYCDKEMRTDKKSNLITVNKAERKKYKKDICQECIEKILSKKTQ